ncbi:MAG: chemotaxis protein CheA [Desulfomonilia bacterium]|jgi:two-component system chemotaxis sensor kinase CheA|nr:chemotaxis protein CheA [Desulfomonilia bacterium]HPW68960.1 chemotaxis protein CheA [Deltaproteobacteria bacterium]
MAIDELVQVFLDESEDEIRELEAGLIKLEEDQDDESTINRVFRAAHTIKGSAGLVGFEEVSNFTHNIENILDRIRNKDLRITKKLTSNLLSAVDLLKRMITASAEGEDLDRTEIENITLTLKRFTGTGRPAEGARSSGSKEQNEEKERVLCVSMRFRPDILSTGQDPLMLLRELCDNGSIIETRAFTEAIPDFYNLNPTVCYTWWEVIIRTEHPLSDIQNIFLFVVDENDILIEDISSQYKEGVELSLAEKPIGEILVEKGIVKTADIEEVLKGRKTTGEALVEKGKAPREIVEKMAMAQSQSRKIAKSSTIRVDTDKLDKLVNLVGEMVISVARMSQLASEVDDNSASRSLEGASSALERISRELQEQVMRVRMVPVEGTFNRFRRVVRDLSFELGKKIEIKMSGTDTELDKNVIEQIGDPLKHMIRNSIDHGIESPEERRRLGKPAEGTIWLKAFQREGNIFIEISDDGKGIDKDKVLAKAIDKSMAEPGRTYPDKEIFEMLFAPGLSTSEKVSEISGRGVGMDVVRKNIEDLHGSIEIISEKGKGSTFRVKLPLTLAIIDGMMVRVGNEVLTIPLSVIDKSVRPSKAEIKTVEGKGELVDIRGNYLPLVRIYELFDIPSEKTDPTDALVVVLQSTEGRFGVLVDDVLGQTQAVIKSIDKNFRKIEGTSGATILGNGKVSLILDVHGIERMAFNN